MVKIKTIAEILILALLIATISCTPPPPEQIPRKVVDLAYTKLLEAGSENVLVEAVEYENSVGYTIPELKELDEDWKKYEGVNTFMKSLMDSECGAYLQSIVSSVPYYRAISVMDRLGGSVCMTEKTERYWYGENKSFVKAFNDGKGDVYISDPLFDDKIEAYVYRVSVPVVDESKVIGVATFSIDFEKIKMEWLKADS